MNHTQQLQDTLPWTYQTLLVLTVGRRSWDISARSGPPFRSRAPPKESEKKKHTHIHSAKCKPQKTKLRTHLIDNEQARQDTIRHDTIRQEKTWRDKTRPKRGFESTHQTTRHLLHGAKQTLGARQIIRTRHQVTTKNVVPDDHHARTRRVGHSRPALLFQKRRTSNSKGILYDMVWYHKKRNNKKH